MRTLFFAPAALALLGGLSVASGASAQAVLPESLSIRLFVDHDKDIVKQDMDQSLFGPSLQLGSHPCPAGDIHGTRYKAVMKDGENISLAEENIGDLPIILHGELFEPETGNISGGPVILPSGMVKVCLKYVSGTVFIDILDTTTGRLLAKIRVGSFIESALASDMPVSLTAEEESKAEAVWKRYLPFGIGVAVLLLMIACFLFWKRWQRR